MKTIRTFFLVGSILAILSLNIVTSASERIPERIKAVLQQQDPFAVFPGQYQIIENQSTECPGILDVIIVGDKTDERDSRKLKFKGLGSIFSSTFDRINQGVQTYPDPIGGGFKTQSTFKNGKLEYWEQYCQYRYPYKDWWKCTEWFWLGGVEVLSDRLIRYSHLYNIRRDRVWCDYQKQ
jgi:hypothetical protein